MLKIGSFCSGIGSPEQAIKDLNINHSIEFACEIDKYARMTYQANHEVKIMYEDLTKIDYSSLPDVDLFVAGFPCQSFSIAGKRLGFEDTRGTIFFHILEYLKTKKPDMFILENVKGLLSHDKGKTFDVIINSLAATVNGQCLMFPNSDTLDYNVYYQVLNAKDYGIPQNRERVFIVGFKNNQAFNFPKKQELKLKLKDLLESNADEKYYLSEKMIKVFLSKDNNFNGKFEPKTINDLVANTLTARCFKSGVTDNYIQLQKISGTNQGDRVYSVNGLSSCLGSNGGGGGAKTGLYAIPQAVALTETRTDTAKETRKKFNKLGLDYSSRRDKKLSTRKDNLSNCITSNKSIESFILDDYKIRRLTPRECARLQGFKDDFILPCSDTQSYKQAGNSIVTNVLKEIFKEMRLKND
jgi:DNA (cytosine-5)-methyltransferase 1